MGDKPLLMSDLPVGVSRFLSSQDRWFIGFELITVDGKLQRRAVRVSFAEVKILLAGGSVSGTEGVGDPESSSYRDLGNGLKTVGMDDLSRISSAATAQTVEIVGYWEDKGVKKSFRMAVAALGAYING